MTYLLDTNVLSELREGPRCHPGVAAWFAGLDDDEIGLSVLVIGEIRRGIEAVRRRDPKVRGRWNAGWLGSSGTTANTCSPSTRGSRRSGDA